MYWKGKEEQSYVENENNKIKKSKSSKKSHFKERILAFVDEYNKLEDSKKGEYIADDEKVKNISFKDKHAEMLIELVKEGKIPAGILKVLIDKNKFLVDYIDKNRIIILFNNGQCVAVDPSEGVEEQDKCIKSIINKNNKSFLLTAVVRGGKDCYQHDFPSEKKDIVLNSGYSTVIYLPNQGHKNKELKERTKIFTEIVKRINEKFKEETKQYDGVNGVLKGKKIFTIDGRRDGNLLSFPLARELCKRDVDIDLLASTKIDPICSKLRRGLAFLKTEGLKQYFEECFDDVDKDNLSRIKCLSILGDDKVDCGKLNDSLRYKFGDRGNEKTRIRVLPKNSDEYNSFEITNGESDVVKMELKNNGRALSFDIPAKKLNGVMEIDGRISQPEGKSMKVFCEKTTDNGEKIGIHIYPKIGKTECGVWRNNSLNGDKCFKKEGSGRESYGKYINGIPVEGASVVKDCIYIGKWKNCTRTGLVGQCYVKDAEGESFGEFLNGELVSGVKKKKEGFTILDGGNSFSYLDGMQVNGKVFSGKVGNKSFCFNMKDYDDSFNVLFRKNEEQLKDCNITYEEDREMLLDNGSSIKRTGLFFNNNLLIGTVSYNLSYNNRKLEYKVEYPENRITEINGLKVYSEAEITAMKNKKENVFDKPIVKVDKFGTQYVYKIVKDNLWKDKRVEIIAKKEADREEWKMTASNGDCVSVIDNKLQKVEQDIDSWRTFLFNNLTVDAEYNVAFDYNVEEKMFKSSTKKEELKEKITDNSSNLIGLDEKNKDKNLSLLF